MERNSFPEQVSAVYDIDDGYFPVIRYTRITLAGSDTAVHRRVPVLCPQCSANDGEQEFYEQGEQGVIHDSQLITGGADNPYTCCVNDACDYETIDQRQVRSRSQQHVIGPKKDHSRPRYEHSQHSISSMRVKMDGGFEQAYDW